MLHAASSVIVFASCVTRWDHLGNNVHLAGQSRPMRYERVHTHPLPDTGYLRLAQIIGNPNAIPPIPAIIPVSKSTWWAGVRSGRYPQPTRALGKNITAWSVEDLRAFIDGAAHKAEA